MSALTKEQERRYNLKYDTLASMPPYPNESLASQIGRMHDAAMEYAKWDPYAPQQVQP